MRSGPHIQRVSSFCKMTPTLRAAMTRLDKITRLNESEVSGLLRPAALIVRIEAAFRDRFPAVTLPTRQHLATLGGVLLIMSCYDPSQPALGIKLVTVRDHPTANQDRVQATFLLLDPATGQPIFSLAANHLTALRTAATSAVATKFLAREDVSTLGVFGIGRLARAHLEVLPLVRNFQKILVCGREGHSHRTSNFADQMSAELNLEIIAADARTLAGECEVICTCTTSRTPLFQGRDLRPGAHLNLVGAFQPDTRESGTTTIQRARVIVDTYEGARSEAGDILIPLAEKAISEDHIIADLHELLSGKKSGRLNSKDITVFKSVGCALEDLVAAELLYSLLEK